MMLFETLSNPPTPGNILNMKSILSFIVFLLYAIFANFIVISKLFMGNLDNIFTDALCHLKYFL